MTVKQYPRKRPRKDPYTSESNYMGKIVKEREAELRAIRKMKSKPKNFPCAERDLAKGERVSQWGEMKRLRRVIGQLKGVVKILESREFKCNMIIDQLLSASSVLKKIGLFILQRHMITCLKEKDFPGTTKELERELELGLKYLSKLEISHDAIARGITAMSENKDGEKLKIIEHEEKLFSEDEI